MKTMRLLAALIVLECITLALADVYTFPVKSINLAASPTPEWYNVDPASIVADAHAVMGIQVSDGYVLCGKGLESETSTNSEAFVVKLNTAGAMVWGFSNSNANAKDACNAVTELADGSILAAGYEVVGGVAKRTIHKLNGSTGAKIWTANDFGDTTGSNGAYEMIEYSSGCGDGILLTGFTAKPDTEEMAFKSYGNCGGQAVIQFIPKAAVEASTAPTSAHVSWTKDYTSYITSKTAHCVTSGSNIDKIPVLLWGEDALSASFAVLDHTGTEAVSVKQFAGDHGEGTDMQIDSDGTYAYIGGQGHPDDGIGYKGRLSKVAIADGTKSWTQSYDGGGGTPKLIYNECWGVVVESDGPVLSCGTGIENCPTTLAEPYLTNCNNGFGDERTGALLRRAGVWQALTIKTDFDGTLLWQQVMSHKASGAAELGSSGWTAVSSAGEWAIKTSDGGLAIVTDQAEGVGVLKLGTTVWGSNAPTSTAESGSSTVADVKKILTVGDSWASYSGNSFSKYCDCAVQINRGIGGTTAVQWANAASGTDENFGDAITAAGTMNGNDIIVLSVGGNDWIGLNCVGKTLATLQGEIQAAADALIAAVTATGCGSDCPAIWMFGYAMVTTGSDGCAGSNDPSLLSPLKTAIENVASATAEINYQTITDLCGGSSSAFSPQQPCFGMSSGADNIHLNQEGYCMLMTQSAVQTAFGCTAKSYDCTAENKDLTSSLRTSETCTAFSSCASVTSCSATSASTTSALSNSINLEGITTSQFTTTEQGVFKTKLAENAGTVCGDSSARACTDSDVTLTFSRRDVTVQYTITVLGTSLSAATSTLTTYTASSQFATDLNSGFTAASSSVVVSGTSNVAASTSPAASSSSGDDSSGPILGAVIGVLAVGGLVAGGAYFYMSGKASSKTAGMETASEMHHQSV